VATPAETVERKKVFLEVLDKATEQIIKNLEDGKMSLDSSLDLDRVIKLSLLVSGEPDSIHGKSGSESVSEAELEAQKLSMSKIEAVLDVDDPDVKAMYDKLYENYNKMNDEVED
jgi:hypothetical protein